MASCASTQIKEDPAEDNGSVELVEEEDIRSLIESVNASQEGRPEKAAPGRIAISEPDSDAYHTVYPEFGPEKIPFVISVPHNTDQEINAIIWFCDDTIADSSKAFDLNTYPAEYKEKYIIAVLPYKFKSGDVRVKNIKNSVGDVVDFVKSIAGEHQINNLNRIILVGYTIGYFSMAYL